MITDYETNTLYLADSLPKKQKNFSQRFLNVLSVENIKVNYIPFTKDIWAVDYMPIQIDRDKFLQFAYNPDYFQGSKRWVGTISDVSEIMVSLGLEVSKSKIVVDGGNVIRWRNKVIMCTKIFKENPSYSEEDLIKTLENLFGIDQLILVPQDPNDEIGHADAMVRFLDGNTVLINDYSKENKDFTSLFTSTLRKAGFNYEILPYNPYRNRTYWEANGVYINYLQMNEVLFVPVFNQIEDEKALAKMQSLFPHTKVVPVVSNEIAKQGGILNCISWNILR